MERFAIYSDGLKTHRHKGIHFPKMANIHFGSFWALFSPKKSYYCIGFSVVLDDLILTFCKIVLGPVTYR